MAEKTASARFHPQAWINDYAVDVNPEGNLEWDVTEHVLKIGQAASLGLRDDWYTSDELRLLPTAPQWVRDWFGPFYVEVEDAIESFFGEKKHPDRAAPLTYAGWLRPPGIEKTRLAFGSPVPTSV